MNDKKDLVIDQDSKGLLYKCPHCALPIYTELQEISCGIFRHGYNMETRRALSPHLPEGECKKAVKLKHVVGCCGPYRIRRLRNEFVVESCGYI